MKKFVMIASMLSLVTTFSTVSNPTLGIFETAVKIGKSDKLKDIALPETSQLCLLTAASHLAWGGSSEISSSLVPYSTENPLDFVKFDIR